ncbi:hypothetical protein ABZ845_21575 [Streptomyces sp. NPDC047022]
MSVKSRARPGDVTTPEEPVEIPKLPGLGTTWYERGARYRTRRVLGAPL